MQIGKWQGIRKAGGMVLAGWLETRAMNLRPLITYIRVSTSQQGRSGLGIEAQRQTLHHFAKPRVSTVAREFVEVETGKGSDALDRRPQLKAALAAARKLTVPRGRGQAGPAQPRRSLHQRPHGPQGALPGRRAWAGR